MQLHSLTSLRFFAALWVVLFHLGEILDGSDGPLLPAVILYVFGKGYIAVTFFFILSGFILAHSYGARLGGGSITRTQFFVSRVARIYPLHLLTLCFALPLFAVGVAKYDQPLIGLPLNLVLLQAFDPDPEVYFSLNGVSWSISVEQLFYVLFPFLVIWSTSRLCWIAAVVFSSTVAVWFLASDAFLAGNGHFLFYIFPPSRLGDFIVGILTYRIYSHFNSVSSAAATVMQLISVLIIGVFLAAAAGISEYFLYDHYFVLPMALMVWSLAHQNGYLARLLCDRRLILLGEASFALYLIHQLVIRYSLQAIEKLGLNTLADQPLVQAGGMMFGSVVLSVMLYKTFEAPAKKATRTALVKLLERTNPPAVPGRRKPDPR